MVCALFIMSAVSVSSLSAANSLDGLWVGELQSESGTQTIQMEIRVDGARVGGSVLSQRGETGIREATLDNNVLEFVTVPSRDDSAVKIHWTGIISGDDITFSYRSDDQQTPAVEFVVHRQS
jgi:hypothetical protein